MRKHPFRHVPLASVVFLVSASVSYAQTVTATVTGTVTDPGGSVIPGAHVVAHNVDTGVESSALANNDGIYRIANLPIGRYQVTVDANGFGAATIPPFALEALQTANFNVKLKVGGASETVTVSDAAPILDTTDATLSGTFTANTIQNFPLNGLDFSAVTLYVPGCGEHGWHLRHDQSIEREYFRITDSAST